VKLINRLSSVAELHIEWSSIPNLHPWRSSLDIKSHVSRNMSPLSPNVHLRLGICVTGTQRIYFQGHLRASVVLKVRQRRISTSI
jgi:hypothetical protein